MRPTRYLLIGTVLCLVAGAVQASTVIGLSVEDQARLSTLVLVGEIVSIQGEDHPDLGIESAVALRVSDAFKGKARPGETVVFHTRGGEVDGVVSQAVGEAVLHPGQHVLVFLEDVDGRLYNIGLGTGVWSVLPSKSGRPSFYRATSEDLTVVGDTELETGPLTWSDMATRISWALRHPEIDNPIVRDSPAGGR